MHGVSLALTWLGRRGPHLLVLSLAGGLMVPSLSAAAEGLVPESAFLLTLGSFLSAALSPPERMQARRLVPLALAFVGLGVPMIVYGALIVTGASSGIRLAVLMASLAPPVGSAAAIATMLGLRPRLALAVSIILTLVSPVVIPSALALAGFALSIDFGRVVLRLSCIVGLAVVLSAIVVRWRSWSAVVLPDASAAAGVSVLGLIIVGLAVTHGVAPLVEDKGHLLSLLAMAAGMNVGLSALGSLMFLPGGFREALTIGILAGNRNVTLAWAVAGASLPSDAQAYLAACVVPVLGLPLVLKSGLALHARWATSVPAKAGP